MSCSWLLRKNPGLYDRFRCSTIVVAFGAASDTTLVGNSPGTYCAQLAGLSVTAAFRIAIAEQEILGLQRLAI